VAVVGDWLGAARVVAVRGAVVVERGLVVVVRGFVVVVVVVDSIWSRSRVT
jgi:hypothetical protein